MNVSKKYKGKSNDSMLDVYSNEDANPFMAMATELDTVTNESLYKRQSYFKQQSALRKANVLIQTKEGRSVFKAFYNKSTRDEVSKYTGVEIKDVRKMVTLFCLAEVMERVFLTDYYKVPSRHRNFGNK